MDLIGIFADSSALRAIGLLCEVSRSMEGGVSLALLGIFAIFSVLQTTVLLCSADRNAKERQFLLTKDPDCKTVK